MAKVFKIYNKGIVLRPIDGGPNSSACNPTDNVEGSFWVLGCELRGYVGADVKTVVMTDSSGILTVPVTIDDCTFIIQDGCTNSKKVAFQVSGVSACTTRTLTIPDKDITVAGIADESFTGVTNFAKDACCASIITTGNVTIGGNLTIQGDTTTANTATLDVEDANITVNSGGTQATADAQCAGVTVTMSDATDAQVGYDSTLASKFKAGEIGSESEIITAANTQTITGNKTLSGCNVLSGKISGGTLDGVVNVDLTSGQITLPSVPTACIPDTACDEGELFYSTDENQIYFHDGTQPVILGGDGVAFKHTQPCHGLAVRDAIYFKDAPCGWVKAQSNAAGTLPTYMVTAIDTPATPCCTDYTRFQAKKFDKITCTGHGLTIGATYYNSITCAGTLVTPAPITGFVSPILFVEDANTLHVTVHNPTIIGGGLISDSEIGSIVAFGVDLACSPVGFLAADGASVSRTTYSDLFDKIGTAYGSASCTTFNLPDLRGKFMRGQDNAAGNDPGAACRTTQAAGGNIGDNVGSIQGCAICCHAHADTFSTTCDTHNNTIPVVNSASDGTAGIRTSGAAANACQNTGCDTHSHTINGCVTTVTGACVGETRPLNVTVNYFIRYSAKGAILAPCFSFVTNLTDTPSSYACSACKIVKVNACGNALIFEAGSCNPCTVEGPVCATDNAVARYDLTTGKLVQNSVVIIGDTGLISGVLCPVGCQDAATKAYVDGATCPCLVVGPAVATDNAIAKYDLTTGKIIQNTGVLINDCNAVEAPGGVTIGSVAVPTISSASALTNKTIVAASNTITTAVAPCLVATELNAALAELQADILTRHNASSDVTHDCTTGFVADEHVAHSGVTITAGTGLTGGGTIAATRTINVIGGTGITANACCIAIDSSVATLTGAQALTNKTIVAASNTITTAVAPCLVATELNAALAELQADILTRAIAACAVLGPACATDNAIARFDTTTGKLVQNSSVLIDDSGRISQPCLNGAVHIGVNAGATCDLTCNNNIAIGPCATTTGSGVLCTVAIGTNAFKLTTSGSYGIAIGRDAGQSVTLGSFNAAIGYQSGNLINSGTNNVLLGPYTGSGNRTGSYNTMLGANSGRATAGDTSNNTFIGACNGRTSTAGACNIIVGYNIDTPAACTSCYTNIGNKIVINTCGSTFIGPCAGDADDLTCNNNIGIGPNALLLNASGTDNVAIGFNALDASATGTCNIAIGTCAMGASTSTNKIVAIGTQSLTIIASVSGTVGVGYRAGFSSTSAGSVFVGHESGAFKTGIGNTYMGHNSGRTAGIGTYNLGLGYQAGGNASGCYNVMLGYQTGQGTSTGSCNILIGNGIEPTAACTTGYISIGDKFIHCGTCAVTTVVGRIEQACLGDATFFGVCAGAACDLSCNNNTAFGYQAYTSGTTLTRTTAMGYQSLQNSLGQQNTAFGAFTARNLTGSTNNLFGDSAGFALTSACGNTLIGLGAGNTITTGDNNIIIGNNVQAPAACTSCYLNIGDKIEINDTIVRIGCCTGTAVTGLRNTFLGSHAGRDATTSQDNTAIGYQALRLNVGSAGNTAVGYGARSGGNTVAGNYNTSIGRNSHALANTSNCNTGVGNQSGALMSTGANNVQVGAWAGYSNTTGSCNVEIGRQTGRATTGAHSNNTFVGAESARNVSTGSCNILVGRGICLPAACTSCYVNIGNKIVVNTCGSTYMGTCAGAVCDLSCNFNTGIGHSTLSSVTTGAHNTAIGYTALASNIAGVNNVAIGRFAMDGTAGADRNTAVGNNTLRFSTGQNNTALGYGTGANVGTGIKNVLLGYSLAGTLTTGSCNILIGYVVDVPSAGTSCYLNIGDRIIMPTCGSVFMGRCAGAVCDLTCNTNTGIGFEALKANTFGAFNTALGYTSSIAITTGQGNTSLGYNTLNAATTQNYNTAIGFNALKLNTGTGNTAVGKSAGNILSSGGGFVGIGNCAGFRTTTGFNNTFVGVSSGASNSTGNYNTIIGNSSGNSPCTGKQCYNTVLGYANIKNVSTGSCNIVIGTCICLPAATTVCYLNIGDKIVINTCGSTYMGTCAGAADDLSCNQNIGIGSCSLVLGTTANQNVAIGHQSMTSAVSTARSVAVGFNALKVATGGQNTAIGAYAGRAISTGNTNVLVGDSAGYNILGGSGNTLLGLSAGVNITTGSCNIIVGKSVSAPAACTACYLSIGDTIYGDLCAKTVGINIVTPVAQLSVDQSGCAAAIPVLSLDQGDIDDTFINFIGTSAADGTRSISSDTTEDSAKFGAIRIEINGTTKWIRIYDDES